jgi:hypothetical protein
MRDNQQIVAGGPWSDLDGGPNRRSSLRLRDAVWLLGAMLALLVVGTALLALAVWAFAGNGWTPE